MSVDTFFRDTLYMKVKVILATVNHLWFLAKESSETGNPCFTAEETVEYSLSDAVSAIVLSCFARIKILL